MTTVSILSVLNVGGESEFRAIAGSRQSTGKTAGAALDALAAQLPQDARGTLVVVQHLQPDRFFTAEQCQRLSELMAQWRAARDAGQSLSPAEQSERDELIESETVAAGKRAAAILGEMVT